MRICTRLIALSAIAGAMLVSAPALASHPAPISSYDGAIEVINDRAMPMEIAVDGERWGRVGPRQAKVFANVPNGLRYMTMTAPGMSVQAQNVQVSPGQRAIVRIKARRGTAMIINESGVTMALRIGKRDLGVLRSGERLETPPLKAGERRLVATPVSAQLRGTNAAVRRSVQIIAGSRTRVRLEAWLGAITVTNRFNRKVRVYVDGGRVGKLRPGASLTIDSLRPGQHEIVLRRRSRVLASDRVTVRPGTRVAFAPMPMGTLRLRNQTAAKVRVELGGRVLGRLAPGQSRSFSAIPAGHHELTIVAPHGRRSRRAVAVSAGEITVVGLAPPAHRRPAAVRPGGGHGKYKYGKSGRRRGNRGSITVAWN